MTQPVDVDQLQKIYKEGFRAGLGGQSEGQNPYGSKQNRMAHEWRHGFMDGRQFSARCGLPEAQ